MGNNRAASVVVCLIWCTFLASPGEAGKRWARTIGGPGGDTFHSVQQTADGGYILAGANNSFGYSGYDGWCLKVDASGNRVWENIYGGSHDDFLYGVQATADGGCILTGSTTSFGDGGSDAWCLKLDASGNTVWEKTYGAALDEAAFAVDVTPDGGYVIAGNASSFGSGSFDAWCLMLDASGAPVWQRTYGGPSYDIFAAVRATGDGGCVVAGYTSSFGAGAFDAWCTKLDAYGNVIWQKTYGGATGDVFSAVQLAPGGGYVVAGYSTSFGSGTYEGWCLLLDASGDVVWQRALGDGPLDYFLGAEATGDGGYVLAGSSYISGGLNQQGWCLKLDASGNVIWQKTYGGNLNEHWFALSVTADGGLILAGEAASYGTGDPDAFCTIVDSSGDIECDPLLSTSDAPVNLTPAVPAICVPAIVNTGVSGADWAWGPFSWTSYVTVLCGGGPTITSIKCKTCKPGSAATIYGTGFSTDKKKDVVYFGKKKVKSIARAKATSLRLTIPKVKGTVDVYVVVSGDESNHVSFTVK